MKDETSTSEKKENTIVKANVGDVVQIKRGKYNGKKARVIVQRDNSVILELGINPKTGEPVKTVVNHKNYKRVK